MTYSLLKLRGWLIHAITASGALVTLFGFYAISNQEYKFALALMFLTIIIDAIDGPLARYCRVKHAVPNYDGARLDYIVDFSSWVLLPAFYILSTNQLIASPWNIIASCMIVISSCYQFCCTDLKLTTSNFKRWPSAWSLMIILFALWDFSERVNFLIITICAIFSFIPTYYSHPFQKNIFSNRNIELIVNSLLVIGGVLFLLSVFIGVIYYPLHLKALSLYQQGSLVIFLLFCGYGTYQHWE